MARLFGKPGKAGGTRRPEQVHPGRAQGAIGGNVLPGPAIVYGVQPIARATAQRLFAATSLVSPMVAGRFRPGDRGSATRRGGDGGSPDLGALQTFRGAVAAARRVTLGMQGGPSDQPGYPGTNNTVLSGLAAMSRPDVQRYGGLQ